MADYLPCGTGQWRADTAAVRRAVCVAWARAYEARVSSRRRPARSSASRLRCAARASPLYSMTNSAMIASTTPAPSIQ